MAPCRTRSNLRETPSVALLCGTQRVLVAFQANTFDPLLELDEVLVGALHFGEVPRVPSPIIMSSFELQRLELSVERVFDAALVLGAITGSVGFLGQLAASFVVHIGDQRE